MTNQQSGLSASEETCRILPVFARLPTDEVSVKHDHHTVVKRAADTDELDLASARLFERGFDRVDNVEIGRTIVDKMPQTEERIGQKIFLTQRPNEPRFAPQQYYYPASKSGVMPSWAISAAAHPA